VEWFVDQQQEKRQTFFSYLFPKAVHCRNSLLLSGFKAFMTNSSRWRSALLLGRAPKTELALISSRFERSLIPLILLEHITAYNNGVNSNNDMHSLSRVQFSMRRSESKRTHVPYGRLWIQIMYDIILSRDMCYEAILLVWSAQRASGSKVVPLWWSLLLWTDLLYIIKTLHEANGISVGPFQAIWFYLTQSTSINSADHWRRALVCLKAAKMRIRSGLLGLGYDRSREISSSLGILNYSDVWRGHVFMFQTVWR